MQEENINSFQQPVAILEKSRFIDLISDLFVNNEDFFKKAAEVLNLKTTIFIFFIIVLSQIIASGLIFPVYNRYFFITLFLHFIVSLFLLFILTGFYHFLAEVFGGRGEAKKLLIGLVCSLIPFCFKPSIAVILKFFNIEFIYSLFSVFIFFYSFYLWIKAIKVNYNFTYKKAYFISTIPFILIGLIFITIIFVGIFVFYSFVDFF